MDEFTIELEGVLKVRNKDGEVVAIVDNNMKKKSHVFYECKEMGAENIKQLLENLSKRNHVS